MASYETLYDQLQPLEKAMKDAAAQAVRLQKAIQKDTDAGNLANMKKNLELLDGAIDALQESLKAVSEAAEQFNEQDYFADGDFTRELLDACEEREIDVIGEKGIYEMFPFKVRILGDSEHDAEVYVNRKKIPSIRPSFVADTIKASQDKLNKTKFNEQSFMTELAEAYETTCLKSGARPGSTQKLDKIYKVMVPMARARKEYDKQAFAFDLARLYEAGPDAWVAKDGTGYYFGTSRDGKSGYRVLSSTGVESFINTLKSVVE